MVGDKGVWVTFMPPDPIAPEYARHAWVRDDGIVFVPGVLAEAPDKVAMKALFDGVGTAVDDEGHVYYPIAWMKAEYPEHAGFWDRTEARALEFSAGL